MTVPLFTLTGNISSLIGGSQIPSAGMSLILQSNVRAGDLLAIGGVAEFVGTVNVLLDTSGKINGSNGQKLLANDDSLGLSSTVQWTISSVGADPEINSWTFDAPNTGETLDLLDALPVPSVTAAQVVDISQLGRQLITAADAPTARADLNAAGYLGSVASQSAMLALTGNIGDYCYRSDSRVRYSLLAEPASVLSNWDKGASAISIDGNVTEIQLRHDTTSDWATANSVLAQGELGVDTETRMMKVGDGATAWNFLPYINSAGSASASPLLVIADNGYSSGGNNVSTSTAGTGSYYFTVGAAATGITAEWEHWYNAGSIDTDPAGPISFNASLKVVSSSNPNTVIGTLYRITFGGRTTATLDPGGKITGDVVGVSVAPGDVVSVRTYLASGTAYPPREIVGALGTGWGGFTATTDLTAPGSAAVTAATAWAFGPSSLLGYQSGNTPAVLIVGDSICAGAYDGFYGIAGGRIPNFEYLSGGGFTMRALSGSAGVINTARLGDKAETFVGTDGSFRRLANAPRCTSAIIEYGTNDLFTGGSNAATLETNNLEIATALRALGITILYLTTLSPRTTSTDGWATTTNQTVGAAESQRVAYNTWVRAGCPVDSTTLAPVAVGTPNALLAGSFGHPVTGFFDTAATVESSLNSGLWKPCQRVTTGSWSSGATFTSTAANFQTATQETGGDLGSTFTLIGAGTAGANFSGYITAVNSTTQCTLIGTGLVTPVTDAQLNMGVMTIDGTHPSTEGHDLMSQAINPELLILQGVSGSGALQGARGSQGPAGGAGPIGPPGITVSDTFYNLGTVASSPSVFIVPANGSIQSCTLTPSAGSLFLLPDPATLANASVVVQIKMPTTGSGWSYVFKYGASAIPVVWPGVGAPVATPTVNAVDIITLFCDGTTWRGSYVQGYPS